MGKPCWPESRNHQTQSPVLVIRRAENLRRYAVKGEASVRIPGDGSWGWVFDFKLLRFSVQGLGFRERYMTIQGLINVNLHVVTVAVYYKFILDL